MKAYEQGRNLHIDLGEEGDDGFVRVVVKPIRAKLGSALMQLWFGIAIGQSDDSLRDAEGMGKLAIGEENWPIIDELRWAEAETVIHAAFFWNVQGGAIDLVNILLEQNGATGGYPKAQETLQQRSGLSTVFEQLRTLLSSGVDDETPAPDGTSDTSTPSGSES